MGTPQVWRLNATLASSPTSPPRWSVALSGSIDELDGHSLQLSGTLSFRPDPRWLISLRQSYLASTDSQRYVTTRGDGRPETFGSRYIFSYVQRRTFANEIRLSLTLRPDLAMDIYANPFAASGRYFDHGELLAPGSRERIEYGTAGTGLEVRPDGSREVSVGDTNFVLPATDFKLRSLTSNAVLKWEWRLGSTLYFVWQQMRGSRETDSAPVKLGDVLRSFTAPGSNILQLKVSWWIPIR
jgi:hypothetical protein